MIYFNQEWHNANPFVESMTEEKQQEWRAIHRANCPCGKMMLPYRQRERVGVRAREMV